MPLSPPTRSMARPGNGSPPVPQFQTAEDYAAHMAALNSGPTGMYEKDTIQSGPHKGKTPDQVYAHYLGQASSQGLPSRSAGQPAGQPAAPAQREGSWVAGNQKGSQIFIPKIAATTAPGPNTAATSQPSAPATPSAAPQPAPPTFTRNLAAEEKSRSAGGFTSAAPGSRNLVAEEQQRQGPGLGQRLQSRIASGNLPAPTPPKLGPAAQALADFNKVNPNVMTGAAGVAQTDALAAERRGILAAETTGPKAAARRIPTPPTTTTPAGVPAPAPTFTGAQTDAYNTAMASISGANAPAAPAATPPQPAPPSAPAPIANNTPPPATPPIPGKVLVTNVVKGAAVGLQNALATPGRIVTAPAAAAPAIGQSLVSNTPAIATAPGKLITAPGEVAKQAGQAAGSAVGAAGSAIKEVGRQARQWWETGSTTPSSPPLPAKTAKPTPPKIAPKVAANLPARAEGGPVTAGQPYLVGEKGPEVVVPQTSGTVIPNHALPKPDLTPKPTHMNAASNLGMPAGTPSRPSRPLSTTRNWRMPTSPRTTATWKPQPPRLLAIN